MKEDVHFYIYQFKHRQQACNLNKEFFVDNC